MDREIYKEDQPVKKKVRRLRKGRAAALLTAFIFLIAGIVYAFFSPDAPKSQQAAALSAPAKGKVNVLVLGVDEREDDVGRSDTCFVVTIDTDQKKVTMLSIPRDSRVKISGHGWDKINHAYAFGGSKLSKESVENLLGIPIDYTVVVNFTGFVRMVDALGGVTMNVEKRMVYSDPYDDDGGLYIDLRPGVQKLTGKTAIEYVRYRDEEGDIGRVGRQQQFLKAVLQRFSEPLMITRLPEFLRQFTTAVRTDMPIAEMLKLIPYVSEAAKAGLNTEWVTGTPIFIQDVSYWLPDIKELRAKIAQIQGLTMDEKYRRMSERLISEYAQSVPREIKVADAPPAVSKAADTAKKVADAGKTVLPNNKETPDTNGQNHSTSKGTPAKTGTNTTALEGKHESVQNNSVVEIKPIQTSNN